MGKFFLYSHLPGPQLPRLGSACNFPVLSHLLCFGLCPSFPRPPLWSLPRPPVPPRSLASFSPNPPANSLLLPPAGPSWLSAGSGRRGCSAPSWRPGRPTGRPGDPHRSGQHRPSAEASGDVGQRLLHKLPTGRHPRSRLFTPTSRQGRRLGLRAVLVEREAAERLLDPARGAIRGPGLHRGLDPQLRASDSHLSSPLAPTPRAGLPAPSAPGPAPAPPPAPPGPRPGPASPRPSSLSSAPPRPLLRVPRTQPSTGWGPHCRPPLVVSPRPGSPLANWRRLWAVPPCWRPAPNSETRLAIGRRRVTRRLQATWRCFHCQGGRAEREEGRARQLGPACGLRSGVCVAAAAKQTGGRARSDPTQPRVLGNTPSTKLTV